MITTWYLQSQRTWDKLCHSCIGSSFLPRRAFPEGRAYAFSQRFHAGSLEALRVSRPEAVVLAVNKGRACRPSAGRPVHLYTGYTLTRESVRIVIMHGVYPCRYTGCWLHTQV